MKKIQPYISTAAMILVGVMFIISAVLKMRSIDSFELYIFSFEIFSLNLSALLARVVIGVELALGIGYVCNICHKELFYILLGSLVAFTLFLLYLVVVGRTDNCHCFGSLVDISPAESIAKNVAIAVLLLFSRKAPRWNFPTIADLNVYFILSLVAISFYPFMKYPHRALFDMLYGRGSSGEVNTELFEEFITNNPDLGWGDQTKVLLFYGTSCKYCSYSAQQISQIIRRNELPTEKIKLIFMGSTDEQIETFFSNSSSVDFNYISIDPRELINITSGKIPTMVFYDPTATDGFVTYSTNNIAEKDIVQFIGVE